MNIKSLLLFSASLLGLSSWIEPANGQATQPCGNNAPPCDHGCNGSAGTPNEGGPNAFTAYTGNAYRTDSDLQIWGGVGEHQLTWTRWSNTRFSNNTQYFGTAANFRHAYQWEMASAGTGVFTVTYPDGMVMNFTKSASSGNYLPTANLGDLLIPSGSNYVLQTSAGWQYVFKPVPGSTSTFRCEQFLDSQQNVYMLTYDASSTLIKVTEPAGRSLSISYRNISITPGTVTTLGSVSRSSPLLRGTWTDLAMPSWSASQPFRYFRYLGPDDSYSALADVQFFDYNNNQLTGTPFGTTGGSHGFGNALDGDTNTYFSDAALSGGFVGIDLGTNSATGKDKTATLSKVRLYPRQALPGDDSTTNATETGGALIQGLNFKAQTVKVIDHVTTSDGRIVQYTYGTFTDATLPFQYVMLTGAVYGDGTQAAYTYKQFVAGTRPLLLTASEPRYTGVASQIQYDYYTERTGVLGQIIAEINPVTGSTLATLGISNGDTHAPAVSYANGGKLIVSISEASFGQPYRRTDANGNRTAYNYDTNGGFLISEVDPRGNTTGFTRTARGALLTTTYADNSVEKWTRDSLDLDLTYTDARGFTTITTRDNRHRITRVDYPDGAFETWSYNDNTTFGTNNGFGEVATHQLRNGGTESFTYNVRGMKTGWTDVTQQSTAYTYDVADRLASETDPLGHTTAYQYSERGLRTTVTYADNSSVNLGYDAWGNRTSMTNELGKTWSSNYDEFKRLTSKTDPLNRATIYSYDFTPSSGSSGCASCQSNATPASVTLPSGRQTAYTYDLEWRKTSQTSGAGTAEAATTSYRYDGANNLSGITDPRGKVSSYVYDNRNRQTSSVDPLGRATISTYDSSGNILISKRPDNGVTSYAYDSMNRRVQTTDPLNQIIKMAYDAAGNLVALTDARNNIYGFTYELRNRKTRMSYPDGSHEDWSYDAANVVTYSTRGGQVKTSTYDVRKRETDAIWNDGSTPEVTTTYDLASRVLTMNNANSALAYAYDDANQLSTETQNPVGGSGAKTVVYTYDADGNRAQLTNPDGTSVTYAYTTRNQLSSVSLSGPPPLVTYTYDLTGNRMAKNLENGVTATYAYDDANRLTSLVHQSGSTTLASFAYAYNSVNDRTSVTYAGGLGDAYGYDATDQLTGVQYGATNPASAPANSQSTQAYAYDAVGNRTSVNQSGANTSYSANNLNEYVQVGVATLGYDPNGNLTSDPGGLTYSYDAQNRLVSVQGVPNASGPGLSLRLFYDAKNRCMRKEYTPPSGIIVQNTTSTALFYDAWNLVAECDNSGGAQVAKYVHGAVVDELLARTDSVGTVYYHHDGLGSTAALTNINGQMVEQYSYDVFGQPAIKDASNTPLGGSAYGNRFLFTGREWLASVGVYDYRNRAYSTALGRFLQIDPIRFKSIDACLNMYEYVCNNPVRFTDPTGLWKLCPGVNNSKLNTVTCQGGKPTPSLNNLGANPSDKVKECANKHEQSHIDDINAANPGICQSAPDGTTVCASNDQQGDESECKAWRVELHCETHCMDPAARGRANYYRRRAQAAYKCNPPL